MGGGVMATRRRSSKNSSFSFHSITSVIPSTWRSPVWDALRKMFNLRVVRVVCIIARLLLKSTHKYNFIKCLCKHPENYIFTQTFSLIVIFYSHLGRQLWNELQEIYIILYAVDKSHTIRRRCRHSAARDDETSLFNLLANTHFCFRGPSRARDRARSRVAQRQITPKAIWRVITQFSHSQRWEIEVRDERNFQESATRPHRDWRLLLLTVTLQWSSLDADWRVLERLFLLFFLMTMWMGSIR